MYSTRNKLQLPLPFEPCELMSLSAKSRATEIFKRLGHFPRLHPGPFATPRANPWRDPKIAALAGQKAVLSETHSSTQCDTAASPIHSVPAVPTRTHACRLPVLSHNSWGHGHHQPESCDRSTLSRESKRLKCVQPEMVSACAGFH
jgi:hypothetical protein